MVKSFSSADKHALAQAIGQAEASTSVEVVLVVTPASDIYQGYLVLYGLALGSMIAGALWASTLIMTFPVLLMIQLAAIAAFLFIPPLQSFCTQLVPRRIRQDSAAHRAYEEFTRLCGAAPAHIPIILIYVSLAEHRIHILPNRVVSEKIPGSQWDNVIGEWAVVMRSKGLKSACLTAIDQITRLAQPHFPERGEVHHISNDVIEIKNER
jgi:putative membrane protein